MRCVNAAAIDATMLSCILRPDLLDVLLLEPGGSNFSAFGEKIKLIT